MRILFVVPTYGSSGEAGIASSFGLHLVKNGHACGFIVAEDALSFIPEGLGPRAPLKLGAGPANLEAVDRLCARLQPDAIVLADYYNLLTTAEVYGLWLPDLVKRSPVIGSFDLFGFPREGTRILNPVLNISPFWPPLPGSIRFRIRACPLHSPIPPDEHTFCTTLYDGSYGPLTPAARARTRSAWGLGSQDKLIVLPVSKWSLDIASKHRLVWHKLIAQVFAEYFAEARSTVQVFEVSPEPTLSAGAPGAAVHHIAQFAPDAYLALIGCADLILCDNAISNTLTLAAFTQTPCLLLRNSVSADAVRQGRLAFELTPAARTVVDTILSSKPRSLFPYRVYPMGFIEVVGHLFSNNPFVDTIVEQDVLDVTSVRKVLDLLLWDTEYIAGIRGRQQQYIEFVRSQCTPPAACLCAALREDVLPSVAA